MLKNSFEVYLADFDWRALSLRPEAFGRRLNYTTVLWN